MGIWTFREAQSRLSEVVGAALRGVPQLVTGFGEGDLVVVAYGGLAGIGADLDFKEFLLSIPKVNVEFGPSMSGGTDQ